MAHESVEVRFGNTAGSDAARFKLVIINAPDHFSRAEGKACSYTNPLGRHPSRGWVVMHRRDLTADDFDRDAACSLRLTDAKGNVTEFKYLHIVQVYRLSKGGSVNPDAPYLVEFVDQRYMWSRFTATGVTQVNIRDPLQQGETGNAAYFDAYGGSGASTWQELCNELWPSAGGYTAPTLPYSPDGVPEEYAAIGVNSWQRLNDVLAKVGCAVAFDPFAANQVDAFSYVRLGDTQTGLSAAEFALENPTRILHDAEVLAPSAATRAPEFIRVCFHQRTVPAGTERDLENSSNWREGPAVLIDVATNISGAQANSVLPIWDDLEARNYGTAQITAWNQAALQTRANEIASNWASAYHRLKARRAYQGVVTTIAPGEQVSAVQWNNFSGGWITIVLKGPGVPRLDELAAMHDPSGVPSDIAPTPLESVLQASDIPRRSYPNVQRSVRAVLIAGALAEQGPNGGGLYPATAQRYVDGAWANGVSCWVNVMDNTTKVRDQDAPYISDGTRLLGRLSGYATVAGDTRPLFYARRGLVDMYEECRAVTGWDVDNTFFTGNQPSVRHIYVNKRSSIRLRSGSYYDEAMIDIVVPDYTVPGADGPSVLYCRGVDDLGNAINNFDPAWTASARVGRSLLVGTPFSGRGWMGMFDAAGDKAILHPPVADTSLGQWSIRLPPPPLEFEACGAFLYIDKLSFAQFGLHAHVSTAWHPPGQTGTFLDYNFNTIFVDRGLITSGLPDGTSPVCGSIGPSFPEDPYLDPCS